MKKVFLTLLLASTSLFAGGYTNPGKITQVSYLFGCGADAGKSILQVRQAGLYYYTKSDNPAYAQISKLAEIVLERGVATAQLYSSGAPKNYQYEDFGTCSVTTTAYPFNFFAVNQ